MTVNTQEEITCDVYKMFFKQLFYICVIVINFVGVKSDCDDFVKCFGNFVHNIFGNDDGNITDIDVIDISNYNNNDTAIKEELNIDFNLTQLENDLSGILANITSKIKEELEEKAKIVSVSDTFVTNNNNSDIFVKVFNIDNVFLPTVDHNVSLENSVLKANQQDPLANNASVIFNNNEDSSATNIYKTTTFNSFINKTQAKNINNDLKDIVQTGTTPMQLTTETRNRNHDQLIDNTITVKPLTINEQIVNLEYESKIFVKHIDIDATTSKNAYLPIVNITDDGKRQSNNHDMPATSKNAYLPIGTTTESSYDRQSNNYSFTTSKPIPTTTVKNIDVLTTTKEDGLNIFSVKANEIFDESYSSYDIQDDNATDYPIFDYIDLYKDTTNEVVNYKMTENYEEINKKSELNDLDNNVIEYTNAMGNVNNGLQVSFNF